MVGPRLLKSLSSMLGKCSLPWNPSNGVMATKSSCKTKELRSLGFSENAEPGTTITRSLVSSVSEWWEVGTLGVGFDGSSPGCRAGFVQLMQCLSRRNGGWESCSLQGAYAAREYRICSVRRKGRFVLALWNLSGEISLYKLPLLTVELLTGILLQCNQTRIGRSLVAVFYLPILP